MFTFISRKKKKKALDICSNQSVTQLYMQLKN